MEIRETKSPNQHQPTTQDSHRFPEKCDDFGVSEYPLLEKPFACFIHISVSICLYLSLHFFKSIWTKIFLRSISIYPLWDIYCISVYLCPYLYILIDEMKLNHASNDRNVPTQRVPRSCFFLPRAAKSHRELLSVRGTRWSTATL